MSSEKKRTFGLIGLGGTFDHLHAGHKQFLEFAMRLGKPLLVGVTDPQMLRDKQYRFAIESITKRKQTVQEFLSSYPFKHTLTTLMDPMGEALSSTEMTGLVATENTVTMAEQINVLRIKMRLRPLDLFICPLKKNKTMVISSTQIRQGVIDREGNRYTDALPADTKLSPEQRTFFSTVQGNLISDPTHLLALHSPIFVVGDITTELFITNDWRFSAAFFDATVQRQPYHSAIIPQATAVLNNPAGSISRDTIACIQALDLYKKNLVTVTGEEDLVAVGLALVAPLTSHVFYGQPNQGLAHFEVTEELKARMVTVLQTKKIP